MTCNTKVNVALSSKCYYLEYNDNTKYTAALGNGSKSWMIFHTAEENHIYSNVSLYIILKKNL